MGGSTVTPRPPDLEVKIRTAMIGAPPALVDAVDRVLGDYRPLDLDHKRIIATARAVAAAVDPKAPEALRARLALMFD